MDPYLQTSPFWRKNIEDATAYFPNHFLLEQDKHFAALMDKGCQFLQQRDLDSGLAYFSQTEQMPTNPAQKVEWLILLGLLYKEKGATKKARDVMNEVISLSSNHYLAFYNRGLINLSLDCVQEAIDDLKLSLQLNPHFVKGYLTLLYVLIAGKRFKTARPYLKKAMTFPNVRHQNMLIMCYVAINKALGKSTPEVFSYHAFKKNAKLAELTKKFPEVHWQLPSHLINAPKSSKVVFMACEINYFRKHALPAFYSFLETHSSLYFHIHFYGASEKEIACLHFLQKKIKSFSFSYEKAAPLQPVPVYCYAMRFYRALEFLKLLDKQTLILTDADVLFHQDPSLISGLADPDIALGITHGAHEPMWNQYIAAACYFKPQKTTFTFLETVSYFILDNFLQEKRQQYLDQIALYLAVEHLPDRNILALLSPNDVGDQTYQDQSIIWVVTGDAKKESYQSPYNARKKMLLNQYHDLHKQLMTYLTAEDVTAHAS